MKRPNGFGTIETLPNGWFRVRRGGGKRETLGKFESRDQAESLLRGWNAGVANGDIADGDGMTFGQFGGGWLVRRRHGGNANSRKVKDIGNEESLWSMHVASTPLANTPLDSIRRHHVDSWVRITGAKNSSRTIMRGGKVERRDSGKQISAATVRHALRVVRQCLDGAVAAGLIQSNPADGVTVYLESSQANDGFLTTDEIAKLDSLPASKRVPILFTIYTGARQSEMWRLKWEDVDIDGARFWIRGDTKNGKARKAPLLPAAIALLEEQKKLLGQKTPAGYVFPNPSGGRWAKGYDLGWADKPQRDAKGKLRTAPGLKTRAGITRHIRFHDLRHTCASHLLMGSWGTAWRLEEVKEYLAHSSITVTERYAHLSRGHLDTLAARTVAHGCPDPKLRDPNSSTITADNGGFEPTTFGSGGRRDSTIYISSERVLGNPWATVELAQVILRSAATGQVLRADVERLAAAVLAREDVKLASEILADVSGAYVVRRAIELASVILGASSATTSEGIRLNPRS